MTAALKMSKENGFAKEEFNRAQKEDKDIGPLIADLHGTTSGEDAVKWQRATTGKLQRHEQVVKRAPAGREPSVYVLLE